MNKGFKVFTAVWALVLVLFNVIAFVSFGVDNTDKFTTSFWIGYTFIMVTLIGQLVCGYIAFKDNTPQKTFYNLSIVMVSYSGLIASFIAGGLCMFLPVVPYWIGIIICTILLAVNAISVIGAKVAADEVVRIHEKIKVQTLFITSLTADAEVLMSKASSVEVKNECSKVYEAIRYSDPMSNDALAGVESEITIKFADFAAAVNDDNLDNVKTLAKEVMVLVEARNKKCGLLK